LSAGHVVVPHVVADDSGVSSHALVPSQSLERHAVSAHVMSVPSQPPLPHVSPYEHVFESSHPGVVRHCHTLPTFVQ
jgi:hypothetical protein